MRFFIFKLIYSAFPTRISASMVISVSWFQSILLWSTWKSRGRHAKQGLALLWCDGLGQGSYLTRLDAEMFLEMFLDILVGIVLLC